MKSKAFCQEEPAEEDSLFISISPTAIGRQPAELLRSHKQSFRSGGAYGANPICSQPLYLSVTSLESLFSSAGMPLKGN
ncbi:hypothetical protein E4T45_08808 [Aureobasidium sp. EXF-8846]|nr:hypothetical protein E4T45_08808 [Aureobasidium sp. EXF-8846]